MGEQSALPQNQTTFPPDVVVDVSMTPQLWHGCGDVNMEDLMIGVPVFNGVSVCTGVPVSPGPTLLSGLTVLLSGVPVSLDGVTV